MPYVNLARYSGAPTNSTYYKNNLAVVDLSAGTSSPNNVANRIINIGQAQDAIIQQSGIPEYKPNTQFSLTVWLKNESWTGDFQIGLVNSDNTGVITYFNFASHTTTGPLSATVQTFFGDISWSSPSAYATFEEGGWVKITLSGTTGATVGLNLKFLLEFGDHTLNLGASMLVDGFALYQGTETTFVKTTTAPRGSGFLQQFAFPNHKTGIRYPQNSTNVQLGGGYVFAAKPSSPPQRTFILTFAALAWVTDANGNLDLITSAEINAGTLDAFYQSVQLYTTFTYNHPMYGPTPVKFAKPLELPPPETGGNGVIANVQVELIEQL